METHLEHRGGECGGRNSLDSVGAWYSVEGFTTIRGIRSV